MTSGVEGLGAILPVTAVASEGRLLVGGCDAVELAEAHGTPLLVFDLASLEERIAAFTTALQPDRVFYAAKAFLCGALCRLLEGAGLGLDVCSGGELAAGLAAGFPPERMILHGNNKSPAELSLAARAGVGRVVVDALDEIELLERCGLRTRLLVRVTPGVEAHTHDFVRTGQEDSKFGFTLARGVALEAMRAAAGVPGCELVGLHAHIGSQIFELSAFDLAIERLADFSARCRHELGWAPTELNLGGGLGIAHTRAESPPDPAEWLERAGRSVEREFSARSLQPPALAAEPGRSLVGPAAVALYRVGVVKRIPGVRVYVSVDGGMSDNVRPALYGARYEAFLANRTGAPPGPPATVVGKHCESGDVLVREAHLPEDVGRGDLLCLPAAGAYTYAMASNYNRVPRPAVVMVAEGRATEIIRRETHEDLMSLDPVLNGAAAR